MRKQVVALAAVGVLSLGLPLGAAVAAPEVRSGATEGVVTQPLAENPTPPPEKVEKINKGEPGAVAAGVVMSRLPAEPEGKGRGKGRGKGLGNGCIPGYGKGGECLPVATEHRHEGEYHPWTCGEVRTLFPEGITTKTKGSKADVLGLDTNGDGVACGVGDA